MSITRIFAPHKVVPKPVPMKAPVKGLCAICASEQPKKLYGCFACQQSACRDCHHNFFRTKTLQAVCMYCDVPWTHHQVTQLFGPTYIEKHYKPMRRQQCWIIQRSRLPSLAPKIEQYRNKKIYRLIYSVLIRNTFRGYCDRKLRKNLLTYSQNLPHAEIVRLIQEMLDMIDFRNSLYENYDEVQVNKLTDNILDLRNQIINAINKLTDSEALSNNKLGFTPMCPVDGCSGIITDRNKCSSGHTVCCKCNTVYQGAYKSHECNPDDLRAMEIIKQSTKSCPNCHAPIHRIEGCNQMFCTICHTPFDWITGHIIKSHFHNPHHQEWLASRTNETESTTAIVTDFTDDIEYRLWLQTLNSGHFRHRIFTLFNKNYPKTVHTILRDIPQFIVELLDPFNGCGAEYLLAVIQKLEEKNEDMLVRLACGDLTEKYVRQKLLLNIWRIEGIQLIIPYTRQLVNRLQKYTEEFQAVYVVSIRQHPTDFLSDNDIKNYVRKCMWAVNMFRAYAKPIVSAYNIVLNSSGYHFRLRWHIQF